MDLEFEKIKNGKIGEEEVWNDIVNGKREEVERNECKQWYR